MSCTSIRFALILLSLASTSMAQRASAVFLFTPTSRPIAGTSVPVEVMAIDASSNPLGNSNAIWSTTNASVAEFKGGQIVTKIPGIVDLSATVFGARGVLRLQVLPARIEIIPAEGRVEAGHQVDYKAIVRNAAGEEIPDLPLRWEVLGRDGGTNNGISIARTSGSLSASAVGRYLVRAHFDYPNTGNGQFQPVFTATTSLTVDPTRYYKTTTLLSSQARVSGFRLTPRNTRLSMNESGDLSFLASAEGLGTAAVRARGKSLEIASLSGEAVARGGMVMHDFEDLTINNSSELLLVAGHYGIGDFNAGRSLFIGSRPGLTRAASMVGLITSGADSLSNFSIGRRSFNSQGHYAYLANFNPTSTRISALGLFISDGSFDELVFKSTDSLPGLTAPFTFNSEFALDDQDNFWFWVTDASGRLALCYRSASQGIVRVILSPTVDLANYKPVQIARMACSPGGAVAFRLRDASLGWARVVLLRPTLDGARLTPLSGDHRDIFAVNDKGDIVMAGSLGGGSFGLYFIPFTGPMRALALAGMLASNGDMYLDFTGAAMNAKGDIAFTARTNFNPTIVVREAGAKDEVIFPQPNLRVPDSLRLVPMAFVSNNRSTEPKIFLGNSQVSVAEISSRGPKVVLTPDIVLPNGQYFGDINFATGQPDGALTVVSEAAVYRYDNQGFATSAPGRSSLPTGLQNRATSVASNSSGATVSFHSFASVTNRLNLTIAGQTRWLANIGNPSDPALRTNAPGGGYFLSMNRFEIDDEGTVYLFATTSNNRSGLFAYRNGEWSELAIVNQSLLEVTRIQSVGNWDVGADRAFVIFGLGPGRQAVAECRAATGCRTLFDLNSDNPRGTQLGSFGLLSANRKNDFALSCNASQNEDVIVVPQGGSMRLVLGKDTPLPGGEWILNLRALQLRDDGRVLMTVFTTNENAAILEGSPLN